MVLVALISSIIVHLLNVFMYDLYISYENYML